MENKSGTHQKPHANSTYTTPKQEIDNIAYFLKSGDLINASNLCRKILHKQPRHPTVLPYAGIIALQLNQPEKALRFLERAMQGSPQDATLYNYAGEACFDLNNFERSIQYYNQAVQLQPVFGRAYYNLASTYAHLHELALAELNYLKAIECNYAHPAIYNNLGNVLQQQDNVDEAIKNYQIALSLKPDYAECHHNLGFALQKQNQHREAVIAFHKAIALEPDYIDAHHHLANSYGHLERWEDAILHLCKILALTSDVDIYQQLAAIYLELQNHDKIKSTCIQGLRQHPNNLALLCVLMKALKTTCSWDEIEHWKAHILKQVDNHLQKKNMPLNINGFIFLYLETPDEKSLAISQTAVKQNFTDKLDKIREQLNFNFNRAPKSKLRIGYVSGDIRNHPTAHLIMSMFSHHNRERFEVYLYSIGPRDDSIYSKHIPTLCDHFVDLYEKSIEQSAKQIYEDQIDFLVDINGYTSYNKAPMFALKPAPIQLNFLGYPASLGADYINYMITDPFVAPIENAHFYSEKLFYMPYTYFITDDQQVIAPEIPTRKQFGLPKDAFIFCCFNQYQKIDSRMFDIWMRILQQSPQSVLWLYVTVESAQKKLQQEAQKRGIDENRLVFASWLPKNQHLARLQLADLFLDTFAYNAHTTAIDALWANVPLITVPGSSIATRASGGILLAIDLPELIAKDEKQYEELAIFYAQHPEALSALKEKLAQHKKTKPLFNTKLYVQNLEKGLEKIWALYLQNKPDEHIFVSRL